MKPFLKYLQERSLLAPLMISAALGAGQAQTPQETTKETQTETVADHFGGEHIRKLYGAVMSAEHRGRGITDPFAFDERLYIRTKDKSGKSSAYGPVQITRNTARGFLKQNPELFKGNEDYVNKFVEQGSKMLKSKVTDPVYGAGCKGDLCSEQYNTNYQAMASGIMRGKMKELKLDDTRDLTPEERERFITSWRGTTRKQDPAYFAAIDAAFK